MPVRSVITVAESSSPGYVQEKSASRPVCATFTPATSPERCGLGKAPCVQAVAGASSGVTDIALRTTA